MFELSSIFSSFRLVLFQNSLNVLKGCMLSVSFHTLMLPVSFLNFKIDFSLLSCSLIIIKDIKESVEAVCVQSIESVIRER